MFVMLYILDVYKPVQNELFRDAAETFTKSIDHQECLTFQILKSF